MSHLISEAIRTVIARHTGQPVTMTLLDQMHEEIRQALGLHRPARTAGQSPVRRAISAVGKSATLVLKRDTDLVYAMAVNRLGGETGWITPKGEYVAHTLTPGTSIPNTPTHSQMLHAHPQGKRFEFLDEAIEHPQ